MNRNRDRQPARRLWRPAIHAGLNVKEPLPECDVSREASRNASLGRRKSQGSGRKRCLVSARFSSIPAFLGLLIRRFVSALRVRVSRQCDRTTVAASWGSPKSPRRPSASSQARIHDIHLVILSCLGFLILLGVIFSHAPPPRKIQPRLLIGRNLANYFRRIASEIPHIQAYTVAMLISTSYPRRGARNPGRQAANHRDMCRAYPLTIGPRPCPATREAAGVLAPRANDFSPCPGGCPMPRQSPPPNSVRNNAAAKPFEDGRVSFGRHAERR